MEPTIQSLLEHVQKGYSYDTWVNERGNTVYRSTLSSDRYRYDSILHREAGWQQYDTWQDAHYFGVWVSIDKLATFTYCEDDLSLVVCPDKEHLKAELEDAERVYGAPPPMAVAIGMDGTRTEFYDERPKL